MNAMFKKGMLASVLAVAASSAMAASSIDIQVTGKIVPGSCTPAFVSGGGVADFGTMKAADLNATAQTKLADLKVIPISITCESATRVGVTFNDAHADSAPTADVTTTFANLDLQTGPDYTAGLGMYNSKPIGAYSMGIDKTVGAATNADGDNLYTIVSSNSGETWGTKGIDYTPVKTDKSEIYTFSDVQGGITPSAQTKFNFNVAVSAIINPTDDLNITDEATLDGLTNVELVYL
ncbi:DUF1120 domain-containing protein [Enterobacter chuandaensis]|uniref:DUF1120 domain-containing protein n=1 Tax=Enterobacter chuandaensis TaxID=2497875 RepID=UPI0020760EDB|nr:DUF1120 domain-containing protein [Enterobacter chuandaensis]MCM7591324.1 DUF1120 domain-containing protein [Enterobacter chuandaensis]